MNPDSKGIFICMEGLDGSGKSTQCGILAEKFRSLGKNVLQIRDPGGPEISEKIRGILLDPENQKMGSRTELLLYQAARAQLVDEMVSPVIEKGDVVISDRFYWSTLAYQGFARNLDLNDIEMLNNFAVGQFHPDLTFIFDISLEQMQQRLKSSGKIADRLERESRDFFVKVKEGYLTMAKNRPEEIVILSGDDSVEIVSEKVQKELNERKIL